MFLKKAPGGSTLGFRTDHPYKLVPDHPRILFLGDSYTEGSGRSSACNYPNVVETVLRDQRGAVEVMNAGVAGYGPVDALSLLGLLREDGYRFDALVYNLFTENDFTDNLPETDRRIAGGIIFRSPRSWFLRMFHPLNSYLFRYALVVWQLSTLSTEERKPISLNSGPCIYSEEKPSEISPLLRELIQQRLAGSQRVARSKRAQQELLGAIAAMKAEADKMGIPFFIVMFPDRVVADAELRERLNIGTDRTGHCSIRCAHLFMKQFPIRRFSISLRSCRGVPACTAQTILTYRTWEIELLATMWEKNLLSGSRPQDAEFRDALLFIVPLLDTTQTLAKSAHRASRIESLPRSTMRWHARARPTAAQ